MRIAQSVDPVHDALKEGGFPSHQTLEAQIHDVYFRRNYN